MKSLKTIIAGFAFLLSGTIGFASEKLSENILFASNNFIESEEGFIFYLFILFMIIGIVLLIKGLISGE